MRTRLLNHCLSLGEENVERLKQELDALHRSAITETKSSAGDKHETSRAMVHLEAEKLQGQLAEAELLLQEVKKATGVESGDRITLGSLIHTNKDVFLIAAGFGRVQFENSEYLVVSSRSPIAKQMLGKAAGEEFSLNGRVYQIRKIK